MVCRCASIVPPCPRESRVLRSTWPSERWRGGEVSFSTSSPSIALDVQVAGSPLHSLHAQVHYVHSYSSSGEGLLSWGMRYMT
jgi:hypothetical protein